MEGDAFGQDKLDFTQLEKSGRIKYEHNEKGKKTPENHIGIPGGTIPTNKGTYMVGTIFAKSGTVQYDLAKACLDDIENVREWNKGNPNNPRTMGFSIEGGVLRDANKKFIKGVVTDVVLTPHPINTDSWCDVLKSNGAFTAGSGSEKSELSGSEAGRKESLQGDDDDDDDDDDKKKKGKKKKKKDKKKENNFVNLLYRGVNTMDFKDKLQVEAYLREHDHTPEEAIQKANEWQNEQDKRKGNKEKIQKAIVGIDGSLTGLVEFHKSMEANVILDEMKKSFVSSIEGTKSADDMTDPTGFMKAIAENTLSFQASMTEQNVNISKAIGIVLETQKEQFGVQSSLLVQVEDLVDQNADLVSENNLLRKSIQTMEKPISKSQKVGDDPPTDPPTDPPKAPNHLEVKNAFLKAISDVENPMALMDEQIRYETSMNNFDAINKSTKEILYKSGLEKIEK